jgi:hypothetical protein
VKNRGFRALINYIDPKYIIADSKVLKNLVENAYNEKKIKCTERTWIVSDIFVTFDTYRCINFINKNLSFETEKVNGIHTSVSLIKNLKTII